MKTKTKAKSKLINIKRLEEMKEKVIDLFIKEKMTLFESKIIMNEIVNDLEIDKEKDIMNNILEDLKGGDE
jgi:translation initiation factor RLI1